MLTLEVVEKLEVLTPFDSSWVQTLEKPDPHSGLFIAALYRAGSQCPSI